MIRRLTGSVSHPPRHAATRTAPAVRRMPFPLTMQRVYRLPAGVVNGIGAHRIGSCSAVQRTCILRQMGFRQGEA